APFPNCFSMAATAEAMALSFSRIFDMKTSDGARPRKPRASSPRRRDPRSCSGRSRRCPVSGRRASGIRTARPAFGHGGAPGGIMMSGMAPQPILLLDAFSLLYRAFFALPPLTTRAGEPTSGLYGLSVLLLKLLREQRPKGAAFALDLPRPTFRHER